MRRLAQLPGRRGPDGPEGLRPLERRLLRWRADGASPEDLAPRFRRSPDHIARILELVDFKRTHPDHFTGG